MKYPDDQVYTWHKDYSDYSTTARAISAKYGVKHETMLCNFRRLGLPLRPPGFRVNNARGIYGEDPIKLAYLHMYNHQYKRRAIRKGLVFSITPEQFIQIATACCYYCGTSYLDETRSVHKVKFPMLTVDRLDPSLGYSYDNCVPCCKKCNFSKANFTPGEWVEHMQKVLFYMGKI